MQPRCRRGANFMRPFCFVWCCILILLPVGQGWGATIELKDGTKVRGNIIKRVGAKVVVDVEGMQIEFPERDIRTVDGKPLPRDIRAIYAGRAELAPEDSDAHYALALWCEKHGLRKEMQHELDTALAIDPLHEKANLKLGRCKYKGMWFTPKELKAKGLVCYSGQWLTKKEAAKVKGKVYYLGQWLTPREKKYLQDRQFSRYKNLWTTHNVCDLRQQIRIINLVNQWKLSKGQMKQMFDALCQAEKERKLFMAQRDIINEQCEKAWLDFRNVSLYGVNRGFDAPRHVEARAGMAEKAILALKSGYIHRMSENAEKVMTILAPPQRNVFVYGYCGMCHCPRNFPMFVYPESKATREKYCKRCHDPHIGTKARKKKDTAGVVSNATALETLQRVREATPDEYEKMKQGIVKQYAKRRRTPKVKSSKKGMMRQAAIVCSMLHQIRQMPQQDLMRPLTVEQMKTACGMCHAIGADRRGVPNQKTMQMVTKVKAWRPNQITMMAQMMFREYGKMRGAYYVRDAGAQTAEAMRVLMALKMARELDDSMFVDMKDVLANVLEGKSTLAALETVRAKAKKKMESIKTHQKAGSMIADCFFSGPMLETLRYRLKVPRKVLLAKTTPEPEPEEDQTLLSLMLDREAFLRKATETFEKKCTMCHSQNKSLRAVKDEDGWRKTLKKMKMVAWNVTELDVEILSRYLAERCKENCKQTDAAAGL